MGEASRPEAGLLYQVLQQLQDLLQGEGVEEKGRQEGHVAAVVEVVEEEQQGVLAVLPGQVKAEVDNQRGSGPETDDDQGYGRVLLVLKRKNYNFYAKS